MLLTVVGTDLPGRTCSTHTHVHVGVQRGREAEQWFPAEGDRVSWTLELLPKDGPDLRGPHVQGRPGARFVYLVWSGVDAAGMRGRFRRLKVPLDLTEPLLLTALAEDIPMTGEVSLTGRDGMPRCGGLTSRDVTWASGPAGESQPT